MYSIFDNNIPVDDDNFVVSLMRNPNSATYHHAFLMVEGRSNGKPVLRRYDFFPGNNSNDGRVRAMIYIKEAVIDINDMRVAFLKDFLKDEDVYSIACSITSNQAQLLHEDILRDKNTPPLYYVPYHKSFFLPNSCYSDQEQEVTCLTCFEWVRIKLADLDQRFLALPERYDASTSSLAW